MTTDTAPRYISNRPLRPKPMRVENTRLLREIGRVIRGARAKQGMTRKMLAKHTGMSERFVGLHVFNPVTKMKLVELIFPQAASEETRSRALALCETLEKTPVVVPDVPGFVVNRLLFPYLFSAVRLLEETGMDPLDLDTCMRLGAGHPMGPLALLDFVGLDVCKAIGDALFEASSEDYQKPPGLLVKMVGEEKLGRKSGAGFYSYD